MGYLFLGIALLAGAVKGFCGKKTSGYTNTFNDAILANSIRMILCTVIGFVVILAKNEASLLIPNTKLILISVLSGISTSFFVVTWLLSVKKSAYMMLDIFLMLGILIPLIASNIFFNEIIKPIQWIGVVLLFVAVILMCSYNNSLKGKMSFSSFVLLLICGITNGVADFSQKLFMKNVPDGSAAVFNFYTYIVAAVILITVFIITRKKSVNNSKTNIKKIFAFIFVMAICLFANSYFKTLSAAHLNAVILYPLNQGCSLILSAIMAATLFKEKLTLKAFIGILIAFLGLLIINLS